MARSALTVAQSRAIERAVDHFVEHQHQFRGLATSLMASLKDDDKLSAYIHFIKYRIKSVDRLRAKLTKKALQKPRDEPPVITEHNVFAEINDLAGVRILHLHTDQLQYICQHIQRILSQEKFVVLEGPLGICWDLEYQKVFQRFGIKIQSRDSMYSSVHYVLGANKKAKFRLELQVTTLMEEVWGEVSHRVDYEEELTDDRVSDQLRVLARLTSGSTRLVDCIFKTQSRAQGG